MYPHTSGNRELELVMGVTLGTKDQGGAPGDRQKLEDAAACGAGWSGLHNMVCYKTQKSSSRKKNFCVRIYGMLNISQ